MKANANFWQVILLSSLFPYFPLLVLLGCWRLSCRKKVCSIGWSIGLISIPIWFLVHHVPSSPSPTFSLICSKSNMVTTWWMSYPQSLLIFSDILTSCLCHLTYWSIDSQISLGFSWLCILSWLHAVLITQRWWGQSPYRPLTVRVGHGDPCGSLPTENIPWFLWSSPVAHTMVSCRWRQLRPCSSLLWEDCCSLRDIH